MKKTAKKSKKLIKKSTQTERQFGVLLEDIDSKIDLLVEGHQATDKKIDKNHQEFREFKEETTYKIDLLVEGHQATDKKIDKVDKKVDDLRGEMNYKFEIVFDELHLIRNELKEKVGRDEFIVLEKRVAALEKSRK